MNELIKKCKLVSMELNAIDENIRKNALLNLAKILREDANEILQENIKDIEKAKKENLTEAIIDRLLLSPSRIEAMARACEEIANEPQVVGEVISEKIKDNGITIQKERVPLGVILMIFESRPNVVIDCTSLAIKSGNAIILKGGKEAKYSNMILEKVIHKAIHGFLPLDSIIVLDSEDRDVIAKLLNMNEFIDVVIPRGGETLIRYVYENAKMPVIAHYKGLCHIYIDQEVDEKIVSSILTNAKVQRPGVCNAMETLLYHKDTSKKLMEESLKKLLEAGVEIFADEKSIKSFKNLKFSKATRDNFETEYLDLKLSLKEVDNISEAIMHIREFGSKHTEAILSSNSINCELFQKSIDASLIAINTSTRFNDGGELGLGAEIGISTSKFHAYGAMGAREMTAIRHVLKGSGQIRS